MFAADKDLVLNDIGRRTDDTGRLRLQLRCGKRGARRRYITGMMGAALAQDLRGHIGIVQIQMAGPICIEGTMDEGHGIAFNLREDTQRKIRRANFIRKIQINALVRRIFDRQGALRRGADASMAFADGLMLTKFGYVSLDGLKRTPVDLKVQPLRQCQGGFQRQICRCGFEIDIAGQHQAIS